MKKSFAPAIRALLFLISMLLVMNVLAALFILLAAPGQDDEAHLARWLGANLLWITLATYPFVLALLFLFQRGWDKKSMASLGIGLDGAWSANLGRGLWIGLAACTAVFALMAVAGLARPQGVVTLPAAMAAGRITAYLLAFAAVGFVEETIFRGYVLQRFRESFSLPAALLFASLLFSLSHAANPGYGPAAFINTALVGILLGLFYLHSGSLWLPIGFHCSWNFAQSVFFASSVSGIGTFALFDIDYSPGLLSGGAFGIENSPLTTALLLLLVILTVRRALKRNRQEGCPNPPGMLY